jgi:hypothetical protein
VPEILRKNGYVVSIYFERGMKHHLPHCHLKWDEQAAVVSLPMLSLIAGDTLPPAGSGLLAENISTLIKKWEELNGAAAPRKPKAVKRKTGANRTKVGSHDVQGHTKTENDR